MQANHQPVAVIGAGFCGLSIAYELACAGIPARVFERDSVPGGLAATFEFSPGVRLERFYHHWFTSDRAIIDLVKELGLAEALMPRPSRTGLYYANEQFRLSSPVDLLKFNAIPLLDRVRTGLMALYARRIRDWKPLENIAAEEWIRKIGGRKAFEVMWQPLLRGKFGDEAPNVSAVWFWNKLKLRGSSRGEAGKEELIYLRGGFATLIEGMCAFLKGRGVEFHFDAPVEKIVSNSGRVTSVTANGTVYPCSAAIATVPLPNFLEMTPSLPGDYREKCASIRYLGNVCLVLRMQHSLSQTYWLNVADPSFPFVGIIEHTNLDSPSAYGGDRIAYISKYLSTSHPLYRASDEEFFRYCLPYIQKIFPEFSADWVKDYRTWRAPYSQPVVVKRYSHNIPEFRTPIGGLWLCTMAQIYPEDRGTNYAVEYGRRLGRELAKELSS